MAGAFESGGNEIAHVYSHFYFFRITLIRMISGKILIWFQRDYDHENINLTPEEC